MDVNIDVKSILHLKTSVTLFPPGITFDHTPGKFDRCISKVYYNEKRIFKTSHYNVNFVCPSCGVQNSMLLSNFIRKLNKNSKHFKCLSCTTVCESNVNQIKEKTFNIGIILPFMNLHMDIGDYQYIPNLGSRKKRDPVLRMNDGSIIEINNRFVICTRCLEIYFLKKFKEGCLMCPDCSQSIHTKPKICQGLEYTTKFEFKFIKYCINKNIPLENSTVYAGTKRIPFYIPTLDIVIDLKSNLCYDYRKPATNLYENHIIIYPKTYVQITRTLEKLCC
jgi:hypothetical protein